jgi:uncharacterized protein DUF2804
MSPMLDDLPWRGVTGRDVPPRGVPIPPARLPLVRGGRPLKRWRWVGVFAEDVMLVAGFARVLGVPQAWWAVWDREDGRLHERTVLGRPGRVVRLAPGRAVVDDGDCAFDVSLDEGAVEGVEVVCPHGAQYVWTRKRAAVPASGHVRLPGRAVALEGLAVIDESAGYHDRLTAWRWCAGVGRSADGRVLGWNLVEGVNDPVAASERSVWIDGVAREVGPVAIAADLSSARPVDGGWRLTFAGEAARERHDRLVVARSDYVQPFGSFSGVLPGGVELASGAGVMEHHRARW